jgi:hypothetical protein
MNEYAKWLGIPAALVALVTLWTVFDFPRVAMSGDISKLTKGQADIAVELYQTKTRSLIAIAPPPENTPAAAAWKEELDQARRQLQQAEQRKLELSK